MKKDKLTKLREAKRWSKSELARRAGVSWQTVNKAENGENIARLSAVKIADALGVETEDIDED